MRWSIDSWRVWLFRGLVAVAAGLMVASFIMPWWTADINIPGQATLLDAIRIYGHGLQHNLSELREYIAADETPFYQTVLAWAYIAASAGLILFSTWLKGKKGRWLPGGIGLIYIAYAAIAAFVVIASRFREVGLSLGGTGFSLQGWNSFISVGEVAEIDMYSTLRFGYYLAYAAGGMCIVLALLRDKITGKPKAAV